ncbi:sensor histidine kinase [Microbacterium murale]|uniref:Two-component system sensor histidine kinase DesK n=1 Tax=Microbacterium murale TaxID=1081040 RepID=A0ABU0PAJ1_9MICO|nr:histidine kinase [Microbacterium murale]MDQ0644355.1 two-component system sensor histidine kinase DesK [Microbacterium murale]
MIEESISSEDPMASRMRRHAMVTAVLTIAPLTLLGVALTTRSWGEGLVTALCLLLVLGVLREWNLDGYPPRSVFAVVVTAMAWVAGAALTTSPLGFFPLALVGALMLARVRRRFLWIGLFALAVASMGTAAFVFHPFTTQRAATYLLLPSLGVLFVAAVIVISERAWSIAQRFERMREMETQLAVARERARFVNDLHDIQGQSLHVIKLKSAVARQMVRDDPERAESEMLEIQRLARETISETRAMTVNRYELNLAVELENAKRLCQSAGIAVDTHVDLAEGASAPPILAHVLREATTNLLRHAQPTMVTITASALIVEVANDGVAEASTGPEHGLARLRERVGAAGGRMTVTREPNLFVVRADFSPDRLDEVRS